MITLVLAVLWFATQPARPIPARPAHSAVCPGALYFIKHGEHAAWTRRKRLLCHIGGHDFYGDK